MGGAGWDWFSCCFPLIYLTVSLLNHCVCGRQEERSSVASGSTSWEFKIDTCSFQLSNDGWNCNKGQYEMICKSVAFFFQLSRINEGVWEQFEVYYIIILIMKYCELFSCTCSRFSRTTPHALHLNTQAKGNYELRLIHSLLKFANLFSLWLLHFCESRHHR